MGLFVFFFFRGCVTNMERMKRIELLSTLFPPQGDEEEDTEVEVSLCFMCWSTKDKNDEETVRIMGSWMDEHGWRLLNQTEMDDRDESSIQFRYYLHETRVENDHDIMAGLEQMGMKWKLTLRKISSNLFSHIDTRNRDET